MVISTIYSLSTDKRGACSLLAQVPEAILPIPKGGDLLKRSQIQNRSFRQRAEFTETHLG